MKSLKLGFGPEKNNAKCPDGIDMSCNNLPFLSLCIPTFNRGSLLFHCLKSITEQDIFQNSEKVEVVVSDNASGDWTGRIVDFFVQQYPGKIRYHRNDRNIKDKNFERALSLGRGAYLKLINDTFLLTEDSLKEMLSFLKEHIEKKPVLFWANTEAKGSEKSFCTSFDDFIERASYYTTWTGGFGIWREHFEKIVDFSSYADKKLAQTEVLLKTVASHGTVAIYNRRFCNVQHVWKKGGYNVAEVFGNNYLSLLEGYLKKGLISNKTWEREKKVLLQRHILKQYYSFDLKFSRTGLWKHIGRFYWDKQYFYTSVFYRFTKFVVKYFWRKILRELPFNKQWRSHNRKNDTIVLKEFSGNEVAVGDGSSGKLEVYIVNSNTDNIAIGSNVRIQSNVKIYGGVFPDDGMREKITPGPVIIDDGAIIEEGVTIYPNVIIRKSERVPAGAVVGISSPHMEY